MDGEEVKSLGDTMRAVLAGSGGISAAWLKATSEMDDIQVVGLIDLDEVKAKDRAAEFGLSNAATGTSLNAMLSELKPDAVFDCTVPEAHVDMTLTALKHGCHVLGEKPMANSLNDARRMVAAAQASGKLYAVVQNYRYNPQIRRLKSFLEQKTIGDLTTINCDFYVGAHFGGFRAEMDHVLLLDMAVHTFDAARYLCGGDPVSVYCKEFNPKGSWYRHGAAATAIFEMQDGLVFTYRGSWCAEGMGTGWMSHWRVVGEKGTILWDGAEAFKAEVVAKPEGFLYVCDAVELAPLVKPGLLDGHAGVICEFANCVRNGGLPQTVCTDNIKSLAMVLGAIESAETGKVITIA